MNAKEHEVFFINLRELRGFNLVAARFAGRGMTQPIKAADVWIQRGVGVVFLLIGLNEIVLYWLL